MENSGRINLNDLGTNDRRKILDDILRRGGSAVDLESLLKQGMPVDQEDFEGRTALQISAARGRKDSVETLISNGANVNHVYMFQGRIPMTALDAAIQSNRTEIVEILRGYGAKSGKEIY